MIRKKELYWIDFHFVKKTVFSLLSKKKMGKIYKTMTQVIKRQTIKANDPWEMRNRQDEP